MVIFFMTSFNRDRGGGHDLLGPLDPQLGLGVGGRYFLICSNFPAKSNLALLFSYELD